MTRKLEMQQIHQSCRKGVNAKHVSKSVPSLVLLRYRQIDFHFDKTCYLCFVQGTLLPDQSA